MKNKQIVFYSVFLIVIGFVVRVQASNGNEPARLNVLDYFKLLLENMLDNVGARAKVVVKDIKNGYLKIDGVFSLCPASIWQDDNNSRR